MRFITRTARALGVLMLSAGLPFVHASATNLTSIDIYQEAEIGKNSLKSILDKLKAKFQVNFAYMEEVNDQVLVQMPESNDLTQVLESLSSQTGYSFQLMGKSVLITLSKSGDESKKIIPVKGQVTDENGEAIIGAAVKVKGTNTGTITDISGNFELGVPSQSAILIVSFVGYQAKEVKIGNQTSFAIQLKEDAKQLEEVVVIGYGKQSKTRVTGAISSVKSEDLSKYTAGSFDQQLVGKMSGVMVSENAAAPGQDAQIVIRGTSTLTAGTNPLIVVDGMPLSEGTSLNDIPASSIASVDVLKDAASAAIYGSRASNGVILITTKKGSKGRAQLSFDYYTGIQQSAGGIEFANAYESARYFTHARDYGYVSKDPANRSEIDDVATRKANGASKREFRLNYLEPYLNGEEGLTDTNWSDELLRSAPVSNYSLSLNGGNDKTDYFANVSYFDQEGIVLTSGQQRYNANVSLRSKLSDRVEFGVNLNAAYTKVNDLKVGGFDEDPINMLWATYPFFSPYNEDGSLNIGAQHQANGPEDGALLENPVAMLENTKRVENRFRTFGNAYMQLELLKNLVYKTSVGTDFSSNHYDYFSPNTIGAYRQPFPNKQAKSWEKNSHYFNYLFEHIMTYANSFGDHDINLMAGATMQREDGVSTSVSGTGIADNNIDNIAGASSFGVTSDRYAWTQISYLARVQYYYKNRYQLSVAARRDGSSRFGDNTKWAVFPSISGGWIISEETFFPKQDFLTYLKLRANWGMTGNNQIGSYGSKALVTSSDYVMNGTLQPGFAATTAPNPNLSWETNTSSNFGFDVQLLSKVNFSVNYYQSTTTDLLLSVPVPEHSGYSKSLQNVGSMRNKGFELELNAVELNAGEFTFGFNANLTTNQNEILSLAPGQEQILTGYNSSFLTEVGGPLAQMIGYKVTGVYKDQESIEATPHLKGTIPGDYMVEDVNGDGIINADDKVALGTYEPKLFYGFGANMSYRNFDLSFAFNGIEGRKIFDQPVMQANTGEGFAVPTKDYVNNYYHPEFNPDGKYAQPNMGNFSSARKNTRGNSMDVLDADYLRLRNIQLAYKLPEAVLTKLNLSAARVYVAANNPLTFTKYAGANPDGKVTANLEQGSVNAIPHPVVKSYMVGMNLTF
ncbi:TonB-dependent receptor [Limibacter armeniacum]|uniref:SusC/RagA family TonB-linked outer membrane protein n=1 Tax=Limibacter armeniacum TaxID=466084 RepID=UPI002FE5B02B